MNFDTLTLISLKLDDKDLLSLSFTNKFFYERIYQRDRIWLEKLKDYDDTTEFKHLNLKPRDLYNLLKGLSVVKNTFKLNISLWELYNSKELDLTDEGITEIPKEISYLYNLQKIYSEHNKIEKIPTILSKSLKKLYLSYNEIEKIPTLPNSLEELYLGYNQIKEIPILPDSLQILYLYNNQIKEIPITLPSSLKRLDLEHNQIKEIPITFPSSLQYLSLYGNRINNLELLKIIKNRNLITCYLQSEDN